jgi:hypothetical protein
MAVVAAVVQNKMAVLVKAVLVVAEMALLTALHQKQGRQILEAVEVVVERIAAEVSVLRVVVVF